MPRADWPLMLGRPMIEINLTKPQGNSLGPRDLLADTGAGADYSGFELLLEEQDCVDREGLPVQPVVLGGAYSGSFPVFLVRVQIPRLAFDRRVRAVGIHQGPVGFKGIACYRFLNRFTFSNFGNANRFGLEL